MCSNVHAGLPSAFSMPAAAGCRCCSALCCPARLLLRRPHCPARSTQQYCRRLSVPAYSDRYNSHGHLSSILPQVLLLRAAPTGPLLPHPVHSWHWSRQSLSWQAPAACAGQAPAGPPECSEHPSLILLQIPRPAWRSLLPRLPAPDCPAWSYPQRTSGPHW